jgi:hypothetical protein
MTVNEELMLCRMTPGTKCGLSRPRTESVSAAALPEDNVKMGDLCELQETVIQSGQNRIS